MLLAPHAPGIEAYASDSSISHEDVVTRAVRWSGTLVLQADGCEESFAIGPDGCVWNLSRPAQNQQDPGQLLPTGLKATSFAASLDAQDRLVVFAAHGQQLCAVTQTQSISGSTVDHWRTTHCSKFSAPMHLELPQLPQGSTIVRVLCEGEGEQLHVGALVHSLSSSTITLLASRWQAGDVVRMQPVEAGDNWRDALVALQRVAA